MGELKDITKEDVLASFSSTSLGEGAEATVFRLPSHPEFTIRKDKSLNNNIQHYVEECEIVSNTDLFPGRNFAQSLAYFKHPSMTEEDSPLLTINRYCDGRSIEADPPRPQEKNGEPQEKNGELILQKTKEKTELLLSMSDKAMDALFDDLHFLSSRKYSIDAGVGFFTNTGNALYSDKEQRLFVIDIQPFLYDRVGIPNDHTKGFNTPLFLTQSILPGSYSFQKEHNNDPELIKMRTEMIDKIVRGAERNHLSDRGGYLGEGFWCVSLRKMNIPAQYISDFDTRLRHVQDEKRYMPENQKFVYKRVGSRSGYS